MLPPRNNRLCKADTFMLQAIIASWDSPDPNTQVGAAIVNPDNRLISTGYNSFPREISQKALPWDRDKENPLDNKYAYVVHAEKNAIENMPIKTKDCTLYVTLHPCNNCAKDIIQARIKKIVYLENPYKGTWEVQAAERMFEILDIKTFQHQWQQPEVVSLYLGNLCESVKQKLQ